MNIKNKISWQLFGKSMRDKLIQTITNSEEVWENREHRRGSNFFCESVYNVNETQREWFDFLTDDEFQQLIGYWKTDTYIIDTEYGCESPTELTRCDKVITEKIVKEISYVNRE